MPPSHPTGSSDSTDENRTIDPSKAAPEPALLGAFELFAPIGRGGMAEVWRGVHTASGEDVAVKIVHGKHAQDPRFLAGFNDEARHVAGLDHPGIITVFDYGTVPVALADRLPIVAGAPYLVMEFARGLALDRALRPMPWGEVRDTLLAVLDALAHAHARGILHLDIKPANVLRSDPLGGGAVRVSDFGLARAWREAPERGLFGGGTPEYMPPEQVQRRWRDQGPWSDLYAVGCMAWWLATGGPLFRAPDLANLLALHTNPYRPELPDPAGTPRGFGSWVQALVAHGWRDRPGTAAAASAGLVKLGGGAPTSETYTLLIGSGSDVPTQDGEIVGWRAATPPRRPARLVGAGLGLFALRRFPMVDRDLERDSLWTMLGETRTRHAARAVVVQGGLGVGRSRLAMAVAERVLELGLGQALPVVHGRIPGPGDGLIAALAGHFRLGGLDAEAHDARLDELLGAGDPLPSAGRLLRGATPPGMDDRDRAAWRHTVLRGLLARIAGDGVVVVVIDDAEWGAEDVAFVREVLTSPGTRVPALFIVCAAERASTPELDQLRATDGIALLSLPPLPPPLIEDLLRDILCFDPGAAADVTRRSAGNPLFALQLVRAWADHGLLTLGERGFVPAPGAPLVGEVREVWAGALDRVAAEVGGAAALEVAAAIGAEVLTVEWLAATNSLGCPPPDRLVEALFRAGLAEPTEVGWRFAHPVIHELVEARLREGARWADVHRRLAALLGADPGVDPVRVARHLLESGATDEAADLLLRVTRERLDAFAFREVGPALALLHAAQGGIPETDERRGQAALLEVRALVGGGQLDLADRAALRAAELARTRRWPALRARALRYRAMAMEKKGEIQLAEAIFSQAEMLSEQLGDDENLAACLEHRGTLLRQQGEIVASRDLLTDALALYRRLGERRLVADCLKELGGTLVKAGDRLAAEPVLREAVALYQDTGSAAGAAEALNNLAEIERQEGRLDEAASHYEEAFATLDRSGHQASPIPLLNLGLIRNARADWAAAATVLDRARDLAVTGRRKAVELYARAFVLPARGAMGAWPAWDADLDRAAALTEETGLLDVEIADALGLAAEIAERAGQAERARRVRVLAARQRGG